MLKSENTQFLLWRKDVNDDSRQEFGMGGMLVQEMEAAVGIAKKHAKTRMGVHPTSKVVLEVGLATQFAKFLVNLYLDLASKVQLIFGKNGIIARLDDLFQRDRILIEFFIMYPSAQNHAPIFHWIVRIP